MSGPTPEGLDADLLIIGSGAAGLTAALAARRVDPHLRVAILSKGAMGRSGCSIMAQGLNAALGSDDTPERHFEDALRAGAFINDQELLWSVVSGAPAVVTWLADEIGCVFDRSADGSIHLAPFPGQSRDRKVHRGHGTGLEIVTRLRDRLARESVLELVDVRAIDLVRDDEGEFAGVVALDMRTGEPLLIAARAVVIAGGGGATSLFPVASSAREKTGDGIAACYRAGLALRDMEMIQFLSVGLVSEGSRLTGTLLEEAVRFAGATLHDGLGERYMERYDPQRMERAPRDDVVRATYAELHAGRGAAGRAVVLDLRPTGLDRAALAARFPDVAARAGLTGLDPSREPIRIAPAAHIQIGGVATSSDGGTGIGGVHVAGEDAGGTHGASWLGGNGIAESTVMGRRAGTAAAQIARERRPDRPASEAVQAAIARVFAPLRREDGPLPGGILNDLRETMWQHAGLVRSHAGLVEAASDIGRYREELDRAAVPGPAAYNVTWQEAIDLDNQLALAEVIVAAAITRTESRGMHVRVDHPDQHEDWLRSVVVTLGPTGPEVVTEPVTFSRSAPAAADAGQVR